MERVIHIEEREIDNRGQLRVIGETGKYLSRWHQNSGTGSQV